MVGVHSQPQPPSTSTSSVRRASLDVEATAAAAPQCATDASPSPPRDASPPRHDSERLLLRNFSSHVTLPPAGEAV